MAFSPITSWQIDRETMEAVTDLIFLGSKITADGSFNQGIKRLLLLRRKAMTNPDSILKGRGTRDQIANIRWIIKKAREFQKNMYFCFIDYAKTFDCVDHNQLWKILRDGNTRPPDLPLQEPIYRSGSNS